METHKILQVDVLEIIFDNRNKDYGAYELRKNYHKRARNALFMAITLILVGVAAPLIASLNEDELITKLPDYSTPIDIIQIDIEKPELPIIEPQGPKPVEDLTTIKNLQPEIVITDSSPDDDLMPTQKDLSDHNLGIDNHEGIDGPNDGTLNPPDINIGATGSGTAAVVEANSKEEILESVMVSQYPEFPGGEAALVKFLSENINYPEWAKREDVEGRVTIEFVVNKKGEIDDLKLKRGIGYGCDEEAMRVIRKMPNWKPANHNGRPVNVYFHLPIMFKLK